MALWHVVARNARIWHTLLSNRYTLTKQPKSIYIMYNLAALPTLPNVIYERQECKAVFTFHKPCNTLAINLVDAAAGYPLVRCTLGACDAPTSYMKLPGEYVYLKSHSENAGIMEVLGKAGILSKPVAELVIKGAVIYVCRVRLTTRHEQINAQGSKVGKEQANVQQKAAA